MWKFYDFHHHAGLAEGWQNIWEPDNVLYENIHIWDGWLFGPDQGWMTHIDWCHLEEQHPNIIHIGIYTKNKEPLTAPPINLSGQPRSRCQDLCLTICPRPLGSAEDVAIVLQLD